MKIAAAIGHSDPDITLFTFCPGVSGKQLARSYPRELNRPDWRSAGQRYGTLTLNQNDAIDGLSNKSGLASRSRTIVVQQGPDDQTCPRTRTQTPGEAAKCDPLTVPSFRQAATRALDRDTNCFSDSPPTILLKKKWARHPSSKSSRNLTRSNQSQVMICATIDRCGSAFFAQISVPL